MALESVDLLSLLKRARKTGAAPESAEAETPGIAAAAEANPDAVPPQVHAEEELADLRAELVNDEVLIQRILGLLYRHKKKNPNGGYISILDMERTLQIEREGATFVMSYMKTQKVIEMDDKSRMAITVPGIDYLRRVLGVQVESTAQEHELEPNLRD
ncbi:MAG TPA: hypothetical protein VFQ91_23080 [Bryobacteraceae bacterium]|nr:hypothetical protein [Bryobacteraceae bacterium]